MFAKKLKTKLEISWPSAIDFYFIWLIMIKQEEQSKVRNHWFKQYLTDVLNLTS